VSLKNFGKNSYLSNSIFPKEKEGFMKTHFQSFFKMPCELIKVLVFQNSKTNFKRDFVFK
jgi:hypothetical protein